MSLKSALVAIKTADATLNGLVATRFNPDALPQNVTLPAITFGVISRVREYTFGQTPELSEARIQMDGYAATTILRSSLAVAMRAAFNRYSGTVDSEVIQDIRLDNESESVEMLDTETQAYRVRMDFLVNIEE